MSIRTIAKIGFLFIVIGFCLPMAGYWFGEGGEASYVVDNIFSFADRLMDTNELTPEQLRNTGTYRGYYLNGHAALAVLMYISFAAAIGGLALGVILFARSKIKISLVFDWIFFAITFGSSLVVFNSVVSTNLWLHVGGYFILAGWVIIVGGQIISLFFDDPVNSGIKKMTHTLFQRNWQLYLIFLVPLTWFLIFRYWPMLGVQIAFKDFRMGDTIWTARWIGIANFQRFFNHHLFWVLIRNTLTLSIYQLVAGFPIPIIFALALNTTYRNKMKKTVQYITYMPYFISTVVMVGILMQLMNPRIGIINNVIAALGGQRVDFMANPDLFASVYVWSGIWQNFGWNSIIYLAALSGISPELHESAMIDGASRFKRILYIDIPGILPTVIILLIINCGNIISVGFEKVFLMQNNLNLPVSQVISTYVYTIGLRNMPPEFSFGTSIDLFNSVINISMILIVNRLARKFSETSLF